MYTAHPSAKHWSELMDTCMKPVQHCACASETFGPFPTGHIFDGNIVLS